MVILNHVAHNYLLKFLFRSAIYFIIFYFVLSLIPLEKIYPHLVSLFLNSSYKDNIIIFKGYHINIIELCTGKLEISLLSAFILATYQIQLIHRIIGIILGSFFIFLFNFFRILITIYSLNYSLSLSNFLHDFGFRVFLFVSIVGFYYFWISFFSRNK